jgi:hypothetical protein
MAKVVKEMTVAQLELALQRKKRRLDSLIGRREKLQRQLDRVERMIGDIAGRGAADGDTRTKRRRRPKNKRSLRSLVLDLLTKNKKGLSISELHERVEGAGYKTRSRNFRNVLYQCLYNTDGISHEKETGKYVLKS